jgi:hypothetical protein
LIFNRKIDCRTPGRFRTCIITPDVTPALNIYYKNARIKQIHKENRALRTETTINNTYDFGIRKGVHNLPKLREIGFAANRRRLAAERLSRAHKTAADRLCPLRGPARDGRSRKSLPRQGSGAQGHIQKAKKVSPDRRPFRPGLERAATDLGTRIGSESILA